MARETEPLKISYSGVRGIVGTSLTADVARRFGAAFRQLLPYSRLRPRIVLARDTRPSGEWLLPEVVAGVCSQPSELHYLGIVPTPTVQVMMSRLEADGGIVITASHNPPEWNGFKFLLGPHAIVADARQTRRLFEIFMGGISEQAGAGACSLPRERSNEAIETHLAEVAAQVDVEAIRRRKFRVALDSACGTGERLAPALLEALGCQVHQVRVERDSEPSAANLGALCEAVRNQRLHLGLAQDEDADRLALVSEKGEAVGEEYSLAIVVKHLLERYKGSRPVVVKNTSTSRMIDDLAAGKDADLLEVRVGEVNLSSALLEIQNRGRIGFGGEGNGGIIYPPICFGRDSHIGMALVLEHLALAGKSLSQVIEELPRYHMLKDRIECDDETRAQGLLEKAEQAFADGEISHPDGLKIRFADRAWLQVRPSNTEPILRVIVEAPEKARAEKLMARLKDAASG
jgi:phosphomannomutase